jgi:hypothetical protein
VAAARKAVRLQDPERGSPLEKDPAKPPAGSGLWVEAFVAQPASEAPEHSVPGAARALALGLREEVQRDAVAPPTSLRPRAAAQEAAGSDLALGADAEPAPRQGSPAAGLPLLAALRSAARLPVRAAPAEDCAPPGPVGKVNHRVVASD